jgi:nucleotide-binding universal stress UspA family protein
MFGMKWRESLAVAVGMNARGGMEIIVALIGLSLGVLTREMYAIIIMVAIVTSLMTPPLLSWLLAGVEHRPGEVERLEREKILARLPFTKEGAKLLVLSGGGPHAELAAHLAATLGNHEDASITVFRATAGETTREAQNRFDQLFDRLKAIGELSNARNIYQRSGSANTIDEAIAKESKRGYDAIFAGASRMQGEYALGGDVLRGLISQTEAPVVIARTIGGTMPFRRVLVPTTGAPFSRLGATVAMLYGDATGAHVTALYVRESPVISLRNFRPRDISDGKTAPIIKEIHAFGEQLGVEIEALAVSGSKPENAILMAADRGAFDLLVMGVQFRPAERGLYFGPKVEHILRNARCAVAVVVSPEAPTRA